MTSNPETKDAFAQEMYQKHNIGEIHQYYEKGNAIMSVLSANFVILFITIFAAFFVFCLVISSWGFFEKKELASFTFYSALLCLMTFASFYYI